MRVFEAVAHAGLGGEVDDDVGFAELGRLFQRGLVLQHADHGLEAVGAGKDGVALFLQPDVVIGRHAVEAGDEMAVVEQALGEMEADEAGRSGDQIAHSAPAFAYRSSRRVYPAGRCWYR